MSERRALVLSGGGVRGAFAAGAIQHLLVDRGFEFDIVIGTSTGALIAPLVATRDIADLLNLYENVDDRDILANRPDLLAFLFSDALNGSEPLERLIERFIGENGRYQRLLSSPTELFVTVLNLQTGQVEYANPRQDSKQVFLQKVLASASVPVFMPPVRIGRSQYVDGGVKENAPFSKAIDEGATHIVAIVLSPDAQRRPAGERLYSSTLAIAKRTLELLTEEVLDDDVKLATAINDGIAALARIRANAARLGLGPAQVEALFADLTNPFDGKRHVRITLIRPAEPLAGSTLSFEPRRMRELVDLGYRAAREALATEEP